MRNKIARKWTISKIIRICPKSLNLFTEYGFHCVACPLAQNETLEQAAVAHGLDENAVKKMIEELNDIEKEI